MSEVLLAEIRDLLIEVRDLLKVRVPHQNDVITRGRPENVTREQISWNAYLEQKKPKNDYEIIALVVGILASDAKKSVTLDGIVEFIREHPAGVKNTKQSALQLAINNTKNSPSYGYIEHVSGKDKTYRLSIRGKQLVERLPDRETAPGRTIKKAKAKH